MGPPPADSPQRRMLWRTRRPAWGSWRTTSTEWSSRLPIFAPPPGFSDFAVAAPSPEAGRYNHGGTSRRLGQRVRQLSGGGVRGHSAREAYIKQLANHEEVGLAIRQNACTELGLPLESATPGLMRDFLEKRVGFSDYKTLAYFATFLSFGWQEARAASNIHLEAFCAKGLMAIEQMTFDGGRQAVGWLPGYRNLTGTSL